MGKQHKNICEQALANWNHSALQLEVSYHELSQGKVTQKILL